MSCDSIMRNFYCRILFFGRRFAPIFLSTTIFSYHGTFSESSDALELNLIKNRNGKPIDILRLKSIQDLSDDDRYIYKVIIVDNYCNADLVERVRKSLLDSSEFSRSPQDHSIRSDHVKWLCKEEYNKIGGDISSIINHMNSLTAVFSDDIIHLEPPSHLQAALFNGSGERYVKHRDNKPIGSRNIEDDALWLSNREQRDRFLTCVLYLTPRDWCDSDGGMLRCYLSDEDEDGVEECMERGQRVVDIPPESGRLVVFRSCDLPHEVLPTLRDGRLALTAWMLLPPTSSGR